LKDQVFDGVKTVMVSEVAGDSSRKEDPGPLSEMRSSGAGLYHERVKLSLQRGLLFAMVLLVAGCRHASTPSVPGNLVHFAMRGKVVATDTGTGEVTLDHEAIPGFMDAMIMPYKLAQPNVLSELHPGDRIAAQLDVVKDAGGFHDARLNQIVIVAQARPDYRPAVEFHVPQAGDAVPDFKLLNQSGKLIHLSQFKGRVLLITFIYTRCPLSDYCPRMSRNFATIDQGLAADPKLYAKTHLLSISFDPAYDKPAVLRSYGGAYTGNYTKEQFAHWDFAAPPKAELPAVTQYFNVGVTPGENGTLMHSLSTILIGRDGRIAAWYPTNDWEPKDVLRAVKDAAAQ
jgi:protein SCO1/2